MSRGAGFQSNSRIAAMVVLLILNLPWWFRPNSGADSEWRADVLSGKDFDGVPLGDVTYAIQRPQRESRRFALTGSFLYVPFQGQDAELKLDVIDTSGFPVATLRRRPDAYPGLNFWKIDVRGWRGLRAQIQASPGSVWCGSPIRSSRSVDALPPHPVPAYLQTDYVYYFACAFSVAALLLVPGWAFGIRKAAYVPLPGLGLMMAAGVVACLWGPAHGSLAGKGLVVIESLLVISVVFRGSGVSPLACNGEVERTAWLCFIALAGAAILDSAVRTPLGEDFWRQSPLQARLAASPPDSAIPYKTAAYLTLPVRTPAVSERFFWHGWSATSRGPLIPLAILGEFGLAPPQVQSGGDASLGPWPAAEESFFIARFIGIFTNAGLILAAAELLLSLGVEPKKARWALVWLTFAPVTWINTTFVWPKLLATSFLLLAAAAAIPESGRRFHFIWTGLWLAAAYYAHPLGALFAVPLLVFFLRLNGLGWTLRSAATAAAACLPWLWLKHHAHEPDPFLSYFIGDGRGALPAVSAGSWALSRGKSLLDTVVPGAWLADKAAHVWRTRQLNDWLIWSMQYSKTLPSQLGFAGAWIPLLAAFKRSHSPDRNGREFGRWFILAGLALAVVFWGYSTDGLGRNCLEPITIGIVLWTATRWPLSRPASRLALAIVLLETLAAHWAGMIGASGFSWDHLSKIDLALLLGAAAFFALPLAAV
ncbi:MAG TPA: hypothetical protein VGL42_07685 [Opitutaceae bacterium]